MSKSAIKQLLKAAKQKGVKIKPSNFSQFFGEDDEVHSFTPTKVQPNQLILSGLGIDPKIDGYQG